MAYGIKITLTHNGTTTSDVLLRVPMVTIPVGGDLELIFDDKVATSYERGQIREALNDLLITASFDVGTSFATAVGSSGGDFGLLGWTIFNNGVNGTIGFTTTPPEGSTEYVPVSFYYDDSWPALVIGGEDANPVYDIDGYDTEGGFRFSSDIAIYGGYFDGQGGPDVNSPNTTGYGGTIYIEGGSSNYGEGGDLRFYGGDGQDGDGGVIRFYAGDANINFFPSSARNTYNGGYARFYGGDSSFGYGGDVTIWAGYGGTQGGEEYIGYGGALEMYAGDGDYEGGYVTIRSGYSNSIVKDNINQWNNGYSGDIDIYVPNNSYEYANDWSEANLTQSGNLSLYVETASRGASGGDVFISAGDSGDSYTMYNPGTDSYYQSTQTGGSLFLSAGDGHGDGLVNCGGGDIEITAGNGTPAYNGNFGSGGAVFITSGASDAVGVGGNIELIAGDGRGRKVVENNFEGNGGNIILNAGHSASNPTGTGDGLGAGGSVEIIAGDGRGNLDGGYDRDGGDIIINAGNSINNDETNLGGLGNGGNIDIYAGDAYNGSGGTVDIYGGDGNNDVGGDVTIHGGNSSNNNGGNVIIEGGYASANNSISGEVSISSGEIGGILGAIVGDVNIYTPDADNNGIPGDIYIYAGQSGLSDGQFDARVGGALYLNAGTSRSNWSNSNGGDVYIEAGHASSNLEEGQSANGGNLFINSGNSTVSGEGGNININGGVGTTYGGDIILNAGNSNGIESSGGDVNINGGSTTGAASESGTVYISSGEIDNTGATVGSVVIYTPNAGQNGSAGNIDITAGASGSTSGISGARLGGAITLTSGASNSDQANSNGGAISLTTGNSTVSGNGGDITIQTGTGTGAGNRGGNIIIDPAGADAGADAGQVILYNTVKLGDYNTNGLVTTSNSDGTLATLTHGYGRLSVSFPSGGGFTSVEINDTKVTSTNTILVSVEVNDDNMFGINPPRATIRGRTTGTKAVVRIDFNNASGSAITGYLNYQILG